MAAKKKTSKKVVKKSVKKGGKKPASKKTAPTKKTAKKASKKSSPKAKSPKKVAKSATKAVSKPFSMTKTPASKPAKSLQSFLTPLDDRLVVRLSGSDKMTAGGLYIPDTVSDVSGNLRGHVVAVGRGHRDDKGRLHPMDVVIGDQVVFAEFSGSKIKLQNEDFIILREAEVMGVISK